MSQISPLQKARAAYQPKLPPALRNGAAAVTVNEGAPTTAAGDVEAVKALFPCTFGSPELTFKAGEKRAFPALNVGVILSGGQAPGGHNVIAGLFDGIKSLNKDSRLLPPTSSTPTATPAASTSSAPGAPSSRPSSSSRRPRRTAASSASPRS